jgi:hypothetical protein
MGLGYYDDCEVPPEGAILIERGYYDGDANLDSLFEEQPTLPGAEVQQEGPAQCKQQ